MTRPRIPDEAYDLLDVDLGTCPFLARWVSMADALGWGHDLSVRDSFGAPQSDYEGRVDSRWKPMDGRPAPTVETKSRSWEVGFPRVDDRGDSEDGYRERDWRPDGEPAFAVTEKARSWTRRPVGMYETQPHGAHRNADEPAMTIPAAADNGNYRITLEPELEPEPEEGPAVSFVEYRRGGERITEGVDPHEAPSPTVTSRVDRWQVRTGSAEPEEDWTVSTGANSMVHSRDADEVERYERPLSAPAPTVDAKAPGAWMVGPPGHREDLRDRPAEELVVNTGRDWKPGGTRADAQRVPLTDPAPNIDTKGRWFVEPLDLGLDDPPAEEPRALLEDGTEADVADWKAWAEERPATTVATRDLVPDPGANANRYNGSTKSRNDGIRITEEDALVLQSFPRNYPLTGTRTAKFRQVGNAVPPLLAAAVLRAVTGSEAP